MPIPSFASRVFTIATSTAVRTAVRTAALIAVLLVPTHLQAQRPVTFGLGLGASIPTGTLDEGTNVGFQLLGNAEFRPKVLPFGLRFDLAWNRFGVDGQGIAKGNASSYSLTTNIIGNIPSKTPAKLYVLGGVGAYHIRTKIEFDLGDLDPGDFDLEDGTFSGSSTKFGLNTGLGLNLPIGSAKTFIELRYHHIFADGESIQFLPLTVGFRF